MSPSEEDQGPLRPVSSTVGGEEIARRVSAIYELGPQVEARLLRRGFNDVYQVTGGDRLYVARLSGIRGRGAPNTAYETALLGHLKRQGVAVAGPIAARDGGLWRRLEAAEGPRDLVLFDFLDGHPPMIDPGDVALMGEELANIHAVAETYVGPPSLYRLDVDHLVRRPAMRIAAAPTLDDELRDKVAGAAATIAARIENLAGLTQVACHGDCHGFNTLVATDAEGRRVASFFDFDDGGPGPLAYDLGVYLWNMLQRLGVKPFEAEHRAVWTAFLDGYRRRRPIPQADLEAIMIFVRAREIWFLGQYAGYVDQWGSESFAAPWVRSRLAALRAWGQVRPFPD
jgi:Ser/Thr protein kinase RdoA (MazF antagonist)